VVFQSLVLSTSLLLVGLCSITVLSVSFQMAADSSGKIVLQINVQTTSSVLLHLNEHE